MTPSSVTASPLVVREYRNGKALCMCGCGDVVALAPFGRRERGDVKGRPVRYVQGHYQPDPRHYGTGPNPGGICQCGCGERTPLAAKSRSARGEIMGQPVRFVPGHGNRRGPVDYIEDPETGCWVWQRGLNRAGYGQSSIGRKKISAHRKYYERSKGPVPAGLHLDHLCRNPACVNPDHLEPVTPAENARRGAATKLTVEQVREIRAATDGSSALGRRYGVRPQTIDLIRQRKNWRDV